MVSPNIQLALAWIGLINTRNTTGMAQIMTDDFLSITRPASLGFPPLTGKQAYIDRFVAVPISNFNISLPTADNIAENQDIVEFYTTSNGTTAHGFPWTDEYVFTFHYNDDKIAGTIEFHDSIFVQGVLANESVAAAAELNCSK